MTISEIQLYNSLKLKLGEQQAQDLVEFVKTEIKDELEAKTNIFSTKEDLANLKADLIKFMYIQSGAIVGIILSVMAAMKFL